MSTTTLIPGRSRAPPLLLIEIWTGIYW